MMNSIWIEIKRLIASYSYRIAIWLDPETFKNELEMRDLLWQMYKWTAHKDTTWARRTAKALGID